MPAEHPDTSLHVWSLHVWHEDDLISEHLDSAHALSPEDRLLSSGQGILVTEYLGSAQALHPQYSLRTDTD